MIDLMLDAESLGNIPGCVVTQVTIVPFNINGSEQEGCYIFDRKLHIGEQIAMGLEVDSDTLAWWMQQDAEVRKQVMTGTQEVRFFCKDLELYIAGVVASHKEYRIWSTSAKVDFGCVPVLFKRVQHPYPIYHRSERCARTFLEMTKLRHPKMKLPKGVTTHNAEDDCKRQIADLQCAYQWHTKGEEEVIINKPLELDNDALEEYAHHCLR
jgi:hypothetical protein